MINGPSRARIELLCRSVIRRWRILAISCAAVVLAGWSAWSRIPHLENPKVEAGALRVTIEYPGASPENIEAQVVRQIEDPIYALEGIDYLEATSATSVATLYVKLVDGASVDAMAEKVRECISSKRRDLPLALKEPQITKLTMSRFTQMVVAVAGNRSDALLSETALSLKRDLLGVLGVASITLRGEADHRILVRLDPVRLIRYGIAPDRVAAELRAFNLRGVLGEIRVGRDDTLLQLNQSFRGIASVSDLPIPLSKESGPGVQLVRLADVADIRQVDAPNGERFMSNGAPAVGLELRFRTGENTAEVSAKVRQRMQAFSRALPAGVTVGVAHDEGAWIAGSLFKLGENLFEGMLLVTCIVALGMGWRSGAVVASVLPLAVSASLWGLYCLGFALEQISIAGLIVAIGLLIDDAIVVTESVQLMRDRGLGRVNAAVVGMARVFWANNATTAVACASFLPLFFMGGTTGQFVRSLPAAVVLSLLSSLAVAQLVTPWLSSLIMRSEGGVGAPTDEGSIDRHNDLGLFDRDEPNRLLRISKAAYRRLVGNVIRSPAVWIAGASVLLCGSVALSFRLGAQFFPKSERGCLFVNVELPPGTSLEATSATAARVEHLLAQQLEVERTSATIGAAYPPVFVGRANGRSGSNVADFLVELREGARPMAIASQLRDHLADVVGARISVEELYQGPPVAHPIQFRIFGEDKVGQYADIARRKLQSIPGVVNVRDSLSQSIPLTVLHMDEVRAARAGLSPESIAASARQLYGDDAVTEFWRGDDRTKVILQRDDTSDEPIQELLQTPVLGSQSGATSVLDSVLSIEPSQGPAELRRRDTKKMVELTADIDGRVSASQVTEELERFLNAQRWVRGYSFSRGGSAEEAAKGFHNLAAASVGAVLLIALILVLTFNSFRLAFVVLLAVPYAAIGAVVGLFVTGHPLGFMSFLGAIALLGIYVNHKIYFVDRYQELKARGFTTEAALVQAGLDRMRPVILTGATAILGLLPLTLSGGEIWASFGSVNIFGLLLSIPLSLLVLPAFILCVERICARFGDARDSLQQAERLQGEPLPALSEGFTKGAGE